MAKAVDNSTPEAIAARFWSKVAIGGADECWLWQGKPSTGGYGRFGLNYRIIQAHRMAYELTYGAAPADMFVCHRCDNPPCVNPSHLFLGTLADNNRDMWQKGRGKIPHQVSHTSFTVGHWATHQHPRRKVADDQIREIRTLRQQGWKVRELATKFGISEAQASKIANGSSHVHVR